MSWWWTRAATSTNALIGELMLAHAEAGLAGIVINGAVRDYGAIRVGSYPVFAAGVTTAGRTRTVPARSTTIAIDGMVIEPGDLILGDDDGLVCVPCAGG